MFTVCNWNGYQDEAGVIAVPPAKRWDADLQKTTGMENLTAAVGVATKNQAGLEPPQ